MPYVALPTVVPDRFKADFSRYPTAILQLLYNRDLHSADSIESFMNPEYENIHDPFLFLDMKKACNRIYQAIAKKELIAIHGDYDADGVSGSVILQSVLERLGALTTVFLPHREKDGYGINPKTIDYLATKKTKLVITCDCGISNAAEIDQAAKKSIEVIITDHHQIPSKVPNAYAIIHPKIATEKYPFKYLAGGGVAFKLAQGLLRSPQCLLSKKECEASEKWLLDLVAISSVADMVELLGENRILVKFGLLVMSHNKRVGLEQLLTTARIDPKRITTQTIGYQIAPRINAAGRMDHANTAYMLLLSKDKSKAHTLATLLELQNKERQAATEKMFKEAIAKPQANDRVIVLYDKSWKAGLTGLLAGKLTKQFNKPVFVLGYDGSRIVGSGRAPDKINIMQGVISIKEKLLSFGGHPQACGFRFDKKVLPDVIKGLIDFFNDALTDDDIQPSLQAEHLITFDAIDLNLVHHLQRMEPFGQANPQPIFYSREVATSTLKLVGKKLNHIKLTVCQRNLFFSAIAFSTQLDLKVGDIIDILFAVELNEWNGNRTIQLNIKELMPHAETTP